MTSFSMDLSTSVSSLAWRHSRGAVGAMNATQSASAGDALDVATRMGGHLDAAEHLGERTRKHDADVAADSLVQQQIDDRRDAWIMMYFQLDLLQNFSLKTGCEL